MIKYALLSLIKISDSKLHLSDFIASKNQLYLLSDLITIIVIKSYLHYMSNSLNASIKVILFRLTKLFVSKFNS